MIRNLPLPALVVNSDVVRSSAGGHPRHADLAEATELVLGDAIAAAPRPDPWVRSSRGDGEVSVAPASVPAAWLLADFLNTVYAGAVGYNRNKRYDETADHRLRLRLGIDCGDVLIDGRGEPRGGDPLVRAARLQNSMAARQAIEVVPDAPLVAVISDEVYQRVVPYAEKGLRAEEFREVSVEIERKPVKAWLYVPHFPPPSLDGAPQGEKSSTAARSGSTYNVRIRDSQGIANGPNATINVNTGGPK